MTFRTRTGWTAVSWVTVLLLTGCVVDRAGTRRADAQVRVDAGPAMGVDGGVVEAGTDSGGVEAGTDSGGVEAGTDSGGVDSGIDAGVEMQDGGPPIDAGCTAADDRCEGDVLVRCGATGAVGRKDCSAVEQLCDPSLPDCVDRVCAPGATRCDVTGESTCDARGAAWGASTPCARGCDGEMCRAETACGDTVDAAISPGETIHLDLCGATVDRRYSRMRGHDCSRDNDDETDADLLVRVNVPARGRYTLATASAGDPLLYLRSVCDDRSSQIECRDDNGPDKNASITRFFEAGDYFLVVDQFIYDGRPCAGVDLRFSAGPSPG